MKWWVSGLLVVLFSTGQVWARDLSLYKVMGEGQLKQAIQEEASKNHHALGYKGARIELLGRISLEKTENGQFVIRDVYCQEDYGPSEFRGGQIPAPGRIPDEKVLNTEHTWPQSKFGGQSRETQKSDLHHLFPSDSQMNGIRGNNPFGEVDRPSSILKCSVSKIGYNRDGELVFEPPESHRGNVARAIFYFSIRYSMPIAKSQEEALRKWNQQDPVDEEEANRNNEIAKLQGNRNPFIDNPDLVNQISDF